MRNRGGLDPGGCEQGQERIRGLLEAGILSCHALKELLQERERP